MELKVSLPDREGQICKILTPQEGEDPAEVYIVAEDPRPYTDDEYIYVVGLKELQRNIRTPESASRIPVCKNELAVIAENLEAYIKSWND